MTSKFLKEVILFTIEPDEVIHGSVTVMASKTYVAHKGSKARLNNGQTHFRHDNNTRIRISPNVLSGTVANAFTTLCVISGTKAILDETYLIDITAQLLADCINNYPLVNGAFTGEFLFVVDAVEMPLIIKGGEHYQKLEALYNTSKQKNASKVTKFTYGHYYGSGYNSFLYLGTVMLPDYITENKEYKITKPVKYTKYHMWFDVPIFTNGVFGKFYPPELKFTKKSELVPHNQHVDLPKQALVIEQLKTAVHAMPCVEFFLLNNIQPRGSKIDAFLEKHAN